MKDRNPNQWEHLEKRSCDMWKNKVAGKGKAGGAEK